MFDFIKSVENELKTAFIVSGIEVVKAEGGELSVTISKAAGDKCERCWCYSETVGQNHEHPTICKRCASVLGK